MKRKLILAHFIFLLFVPFTSPAHANITIDDSDAPFDWSAHQDYFNELVYGNGSQSSADAYAEPDPQPLTYQVQSGDSFYKIAGSFGIKVDTLISANGISNPRLLQIGQKLQIPTSDSISLPSNLNSTITQVMTATLSAYTAGYESTGKTSTDPAFGVTYSGTIVQEGRTVAVDPAVIPLGSTLFIEGVGIRKAEDTGSAIRGKKIDVYISDLDEARKFGVKKNINVYVLKSESV